VDRAYNKDQAKQIIDAILPLMAQTGMTVADTFDFRNYELDKLVVTPDSALHPIWLAIRHMPLSAYLANEEAIRNVCRKAAEDLRLLIESGEHASDAGAQ